MHVKKQTNSVADAVAALRSGDMIILFDSESRENEGDFVMAAQHTTPAAINFMLRFACGLLCVPMLGEDLDRIGLSQMATHNTSLHHCAFTLSVDALTQVSTGSSAFDRAHTILSLLQPDAVLDNFAVPGHVFPIRAHPDGLHGRQGHTEGSIALMQLAGLKPASVICEILNEDGTMARRVDLLRLAQLHSMPLIDMQDVIAASSDV